MRAVVLGLVVVTACKPDQKPPPPKPQAPPVTVAPAKRAPPAPSLPGPSHPPTYKLDHEPFVWAFAEASGTAAAWNAAAESFEEALATCTKDCAKTAYAVMLARRNALGVDPIKPPSPDAPPPAELPDRVQAVVDSIDQFVALGDPTDPDVGGAKFLAASVMYRWQQQVDAVARLEAILRDHRDLPIAEYAANELLDTLMRANRVTELRAWVADLLADATFLAGKDELRQTLERIRALTEG
jgi:hypothetical protein